MCMYENAATQGRPCSWLNGHAADAAPCHAVSAATAAATAADDVLTARDALTA